MKNEDQAKKLYQAVTDIDDKYIEEAQNEETFAVQRITEKPKRHWANIAIAACAVLVIGGGLTLLHGRLGVEKPQHSLSSDATETASNTLGTTTTTETTTTTTTTTAKPLTEEEQELHGLCESLTRKFYDLVTKYVSESSPVEDCINMCDYVDNDKFAAWLHYRAFNFELSNGDIIDFTYTPIEVRTDGDFRFVTAELQLKVDKEQYDMGTQQFVLFKKDGVFTILDWYEEREGSPDRELRSLNGQFDDDYFKTYWTVNDGDTGKTFVDELLGYNSTYAYELPEIGADETNVEIYGGGQYGWCCNSDEIQMLRDALANLNCTLTELNDGYLQTRWGIFTEEWTLRIGNDYSLTMTFEGDTIDEAVSLCDYSGAVQELVRTMLEMTQYDCMVRIKVLEKELWTPVLLPDRNDETTYIEIPDQEQAWHLLNGIRLVFSGDPEHPWCDNIDDAGMTDPICISWLYEGSLDAREADYIDSTGKVLRRGPDGMYLYQDHTDYTAQLYAMLKPLLPD